MASDDATRTTLPLSGPVQLADVRSLTSGLMPADKQSLVTQSLTLLEDFYAHLPLKQSSLAVDPVQAARLLLDRAAVLPDAEFVADLLDVFQRLGDLHTTVVLPAPRGQLQAFLPYLIQEYVDEHGVARYVLTNVSPHYDLGADFVPGVEITHWNNVAMAGKVAGLARESSGANPAACHRAALQTLTTRSLGYQLAPAEDAVTLTYRSARGMRRISAPWLVIPRGRWAAEAGVTAGAGVIPGPQLLGIDSRGYDIQRVRKQVFVPGRLAHEQAVAAAPATEPSELGAADDSAATSHPKQLSFRTIETAGGPMGLLRIWNFSVQDADAFVAEVARIVRLVPPTGLILDVRGNPGGWIPAAERLLQLFTARRITPAPVQFRNTPMVRRTAALAPDLWPWRPSLELANLTGERFSQGAPLTDEQSANAVGQVYFGPVAMIVDALCYSACDFFAAGFQDHAIGPIVGIDETTGGGGANVWDHAYLLEVWHGQEDSPFAPLPAGAGMRLAMRRSLRVGPRAGMPVEGLGTRVDHLRALTRNDLLHGNADLIAFTTSLLTGSSAGS